MRTVDESIRTKKGKHLLKCEVFNGISNTPTTHYWLWINCNCKNKNILITGGQWACKGLTKKKSVFFFSSMECHHLSDSSSSNSGIDECCSNSSSCSEEDIEHPGASLLRHYLAIVDAESTRNCIKWRNGQKSKNNEPRIKTILAPSNNAKYAKKRNSEAGHSDKTQSSCRIS